MTIQTLKQSMLATYRAAVREYRRERVTLIRREVRRETTEEVHAALRGLLEARS